MKLIAHVTGRPVMHLMDLPEHYCESCGMLLSAVHTEKGEEVLNLIMVDDKIPAGAKLC